MNKRARNLLIFTLIVGSIGVVIVAAALITSSSQIPRSPRPNTNRLAVGVDSSTEAVDIPIRAPDEFDGLSRGQIFDLRRQAVMQYPQLLAAAYEPDEETFGSIEDGLPWWGLSGELYYGAGEQSIEGVSEESRFILNPYLLVGVEFFGFSYIGNGDFAWNLALATPDVVNNPDFPLTCLPDELRWHPAESHAEVTYNVTACMEAMNPYLINPVSIANASFDITAYNARDFNLNYIRLQDQSDELSLGIFTREINHYLHDATDCGYVGGCNNRAPFYRGTGDYRLTTLPTTFETSLWTNQPDSPETPPDMVFSIHFE